MNERKVKTPKYQIGNYFIKNDNKKLFRIVDKNYVEIVPKGSKSKVKYGDTRIFEWLYDVEYLSEGKFKRYYETRINSECDEILNQDLCKVMYE